MRISSANDPQDLEQLQTVRAAVGPAVQQLDLGLDFMLFVDASGGFTWQLVDIFDSACSAISEILVSAPCTRPYYVPCLWSSLIACCFWYDLKMISMTENQ